MCGKDLPPDKPPDKKIIDLIDRKASECPEKSLMHASIFIEQLLKHIHNVQALSDQEIKEKVDYLIGCQTITLDLPVNGIEFLRARRCVEEKDFYNLDDLSYVKNSNKQFLPIGRLNRQGEALFYASLVVRKDDSALLAVLSETNAKSLDFFNILRSSQKKAEDINLRLIGIYDRAEKGIKPFYLSEKCFLEYGRVFKYMRQKFDKKLFLSYQLVDRFLDDIFHMRGSDNLYQVTSEIAHMLLDDEKEKFKIDGIIYDSVECKNTPVVALKPKSVDIAVKHEWVSRVFICNKLGYQYYIYHDNYRSNSIDEKSGEISWCDKI